MTPAIAIAIWTLLIFNVPVLLLLWRLPLVANLGQALSEKDPMGGPGDTTSYSRVTGLIGAVMLTGFFWAIGNVVLFKAFTAIPDIAPLIDGVSRLFMVGAVLFLPYAFNQIKAAFGAARIAAATVSAPAGTTVVSAGPKPPGLNIVIANLSTTLSDASFAAAAAAIGQQVSHDFEPEWGSGAQLTARRLTLSSGTANVDGATDAIIYVGDAASDPTTGTEGAYGYHSTNFGKLPYAFIYLDVCAKYGEAWSCTLSHEVLELLADPTAVVTISGPAPAGVGDPGQLVSYDLEVCDPTQGDSYVINGVAVSNFVTKAYFGLLGGSPASNHLNLPLAPFGVRPGGYCQYEDSTGAHQINGTKVDAKRIAARAILQGYRRNARRQEGAGRRV